MLPFFLYRMNILKGFCWFLPIAFFQHSPNGARKSRYLPEIIFFLERSVKGTCDSTDHDSENDLVALHLHSVPVLLHYNTP